MPNDESPVSPADALGTVSAELGALSASIAEHGSQELEALARQISTANRVFVIGAGRSGLALRMLAMRLMHLGLTVHVVGDTTTPAIATGDVLLTASGSGTTASVVRAAHTAVAAGAIVVTVTTTATSPLADLSAVVLVIPAAQKLDRSATASVQYAGSLFEQAIVLVGDALFHSLWQGSGQSADELWPRHANLE
jgi:6-phospho-3-hexuloisomerase